MIDLIHQVSRLKAAQRRGTESRGVFRRPRLHLLFAPTPLHVHRPWGVQ